MGRRRQPEIRQQLLDECTSYLLEHGLPLVSLRPLADAVGTSPRMLIYHFGTKDRLVRQALLQARQQQRKLVGEALRHRPGQRYADTLTQAWSALTTDQARRYVRLFSAVYALPPEHLPWPDLHVTAVQDWLPLIESGLRADGHPRPQAMATLVLAVVRGLLMDDRATSDGRRSDAAYREFIDLLTYATAAASR